MDNNNNCIYLECSPVYLEPQLPSSPQASDLKTRQNIRHFLHLWSLLPDLNQILVASYARFLSSFVIPCHKKIHINSLTVNNAKIHRKLWKMLIVYLKRCLHINQPQSIEDTTTASCRERKESQNVIPQAQRDKLGTCYFLKGPPLVFLFLLGQFVYWGWSQLCFLSQSYWFPLLLLHLLSCRKEI